LAGSSKSLKKQLRASIINNRESKKQK